MSAISGSYRRLDPAEVVSVAADLADAWKHASIPLRQYENAVKDELRNLREGRSLPVFDALIRALNCIPKTEKRPRLLEVGASAAYYSEILPLLGFECDYEALDFSIYFKQMAERLYPKVPFHVGDAADLIFEEGSFDIVISGSLIIHTYNYAEIIAESARVASGYVVMARTPLVLTGDTIYFVKEAYGVPVFECRYRESELLKTFAKCGLVTVAREPIFMDKPNNCEQVTYLLEKT
jgi:hypothetical protein